MLTFICRRETEIVAMDALQLKKISVQYKSSYVERYAMSLRSSSVNLCFRELNKAYCGFYHAHPVEHLQAVATGTTSTTSS
jgi:hypothetical protein